LSRGTSVQVERSHVDYHTHRLPQQHQHRRHYGNVAAAVGWQPWYVSGVDVSDNCDQAGDRQQTKSSFWSDAQHEIIHSQHLTTQFVFLQ